MNFIMHGLKVLGRVVRTAMIDFENLFSKEQAVTATAVSTNIIDLGSQPQLYARGKTVGIFITEDFATNTSLTFVLKDSLTSAMGSPRTVLSTGAIAVADLVAGASFDIPFRKDMNRYCQLTYTIGGDSATAGKVTSGIMLDVDASL